MRASRRISAPLLMTLVAAAMAAGCGNRDSKAPTGQAATEPVSGGTLTVAVDSDPGTLNPVIRSTALAGNIYGILNDALIEMNTSLEFEPSLARRWNWSDDGLSLTYHLRDDVKWSDGEPFSSRDVIATYELFLDPSVPTPRRSNFDTIESVHAPNDTTVVFRFVRRGLELLFDSAFTLMPAHRIEKLDPAQIQSWDLNRAPLSNGPYRLASWSTNDRVVLERNPHYWGEPARLDKIIFKVVPEEASRLLQLEIGEVDMIESVPQKDIARLQEMDSIDLRRVGPRFLGYLVYNLDRPQLADARVRNAISFAIDRRALIEGLLFGYGQAIANPMTPIIGWAYDDDLAPHQRDLTRARALLAEAGWTDSDGDGIVDRDGEALRLTIKTRTGDLVRENGVLVLQNNLRDVGIDVSTRMLELSTVLSQVRGGDFDVYMGQVSAQLSPDLSNSFATGGGFNYGNYSNPRVDQLIADARAATDRGRAATLWKQVQKILYTEQPMTMLYAKDPPVGIRGEIHGAVPDFLTPYANIKTWWKQPPQIQP